MPNREKQLQETVELNENTRRMPVAQLKKPKEAWLHMGVS